MRMAIATPAASASTVATRSVLLVTASSFLLHVTPAVAGVIGQRKFAYDLWGDTVNTAARMESNGIADEIQVSDVVYQRLGDRFRFSDVHIVNLKGKGPTAARFLFGKNGTV